MDQKSLNHIFQDVQHSFSFAILSQGVRARGEEEGATCSEKRSGGIVDKLCAVICLKAANRQAKRCVGVRNKVDNMSMNLRFVPERERPTIMSKIIDYHKIIFKTRNTKHWGCPDITVNEFKRS